MTTSRREIFGNIAERLGLTEQYNLAGDGQPPLWVAGLDVESAAAVDILPVPDPHAWILGEGNGRYERLRRAAAVALDTRAARYRQMLDDASNPVERLVIYTNAEVAIEPLTASVVAAGIASRTVIGMVPDGR